MNDINNRQMINPDLLTVTPAAREHMLRIIGGQDGVRLEIRAGKGCGGNEYDFRLVESGKTDPLDLYTELGEGRKLYVRPMDFFTRLTGVTIDFREDSVGNRRIHISNPNEKGRCGCGESVSF